MDIFYKFITAQNPDENRFISEILSENCKTENKMTELTGWIWELTADFVADIDILV